jgi:hypothetical protein
MKLVIGYAIIKAVPLGFQKQLICRSVHLSASHYGQKKDIFMVGKHESVKEVFHPICGVAGLP